MIWLVQKWNINIYIYSIYTHTAKMQCEKIREIENDVFNDDNEFDLGQPGETGETVV